MKKLFHARHFQPTEWDTAEEKAEFANQFVRFVESGFSRQFFTGKFYQRMVCMFGFHAFPNSQNFWEYYFGAEAGRMRFIESCLERRHEGDPARTYADVHSFLQLWLEERFSALQREDTSCATSCASGSSTLQQEITLDSSPDTSTCNGDAASSPERRNGKLQTSFLW
jgi:hypothetical protein